MPRWPDKPDDDPSAAVQDGAPSVPPPTPSADTLTLPDAVKDGDGQDPPTDDEKPEPRRRRATVLLPMKDDGEVDLLGSKVDVVEIENNYQDCAKVRVSGTSEQLADLRERSEEHFQQAWDGR